MLAAFISIQLIIILVAANGPFLDEAIYATAGRRVLEGFAFSRESADWYYREWFLGSPFVAVYDALAMTFTALAFFAVVRYLDDSRRQWLLLASLAVALATITKYGYALAIFPLLGIAVSGSSSRQAISRAVSVLAPAALVLLAYSYVTFGAPYPPALQEYAAHDRPFGRAVLLHRHLLWLLLPGAFTVYGAVLMRRRGKTWLAFVLLGSLFLAPAYHIWSLQYVSAYKHVVIGLLFAAPLAGLALERLWAGWRRTLRYLLPLAVLLEGAGQWYVQEHSWPDARSAAAYLVENYDSGDMFVSEQAWIYRMYLYWDGKIEDPLMLWDGWYVDNRAPDLCQSVWLVGEQGGTFPEGDRMVQAAKSCGHELMFEDRSFTVSLGPGGKLIFGDVEVQIYQQRSGSLPKEPAAQ
jgi:hypothetical protein